MNKKDVSYQRLCRIVIETLESILRHPAVATCSTVADLEGKKSKNAAEVVESRILVALLSWVSSSINKGKESRGKQ